MTKINFPTGFQTKAIHAGEEPDPNSKASTPNIVMSSTFVTVADAGFSAEKVNMSDADAVKKALTPETKLVYIETPCNPILRLTDIKVVASIAHEAGSLLAVDSTFATPAATRPMELGADFVIHSLMKYLGGHGDALGGVVIGAHANMTPLRKKTSLRLCGIMSPFNAWLIMRGIATFPLRMKAHEGNALQVARFLESHPKVKRVVYPGLPSHLQYALAKEQMKNFSGLLTFQVENGKEAAHHYSSWSRGDYLQVRDCSAFP
jgi:methionine-gamma-lyase